jgi:2-dehydro-3-deoxygalactonokinase
MADHRALAEPDVIGLDWGTSSCRAYLLGDQGVILGDACGPAGLMPVSGGRSGDPTAFDQAFEELCGGWLDAWPELPVIACGMVGSRRGWVEAPYREVPADLAGPALACARVRTRRGAEVNVIPGLVDLRGLGGVMRGEETQLVGLLDAGLGAGEHDVVLPGTHSKWARLRGSVVTGFTTFMTGELYGLLTRHSILADFIRPAERPQWASFDRGVETAADAVMAGASLLGVLFSARTLPLTGAMAETDVADYLSGLVIGTELASVRTTWADTPGGQLWSLASSGLSVRYRRAALRLGWHTVHAVEHAAARGLWRTARTIGLIETPPPRGFAEERRPLPEEIKLPGESR